MEAMEREAEQNMYPRVTGETTVNCITWEGVQWISLPLHRPAKVEMRDEITPDPHVGVNESTEFGARKRGGEHRKGGDKRERSSAFARRTRINVLVSSLTMSTSPDNGESYPGRSFSISQLLYAAKRKLQGTMLGGRCVSGLCLRE